MNERIQELNVSGIVVKTDALIDVLNFVITSLIANDDEDVLRDTIRVVARELNQEYFNLDLDEDTSKEENLHTMKILRSIMYNYRSCMSDFGVSLLVISQIVGNDYYRRKLLNKIVRNVIKDFIGIYEFAENSKAFTDEQIYGIVFSNMYSVKINQFLNLINLRLDYYDPDSDYRDDFTAYISALREMECHLKDCL